MNGGEKIENNLFSKDIYTIPNMETIKQHLLETYNYIDDIQYLDDAYSVENINKILNKIREFTNICTLGLFDPMRNSRFSWIVHLKN